MCRAERMCKLSVYMKTGAAYVPLHPFTEAEVHTHFCQPSVLSAQRKGGGISKGGNPGSPLWLRAKHACIDCRPRKNKPDTHRLPRQHSTLFTAAPREYIHARPSERKRGTTRIGCSVTLPQCEHAPASTLGAGKKFLYINDVFV